MLGKSTCIYWTTTLSLSTFFFVVTAHEQKIGTQLTSRWKPTSILAEAAEYVADVDGNLFWAFLENAMDKQESLIGTTGNDDGLEQDLASISAFSLISSGKLRLMEWALTSRAYSPRVHMLQELAPQSIVPAECETFVHYGLNKITCNLEELKGLLSVGLDNSSTESLLTVTDVDHKYPSFIWNDEKPTVIVLYGHLMSPKTKLFHEFLKLKANTVGYVFRPFHRSVGGSLVLAGYGAELQFKSTEYLAQDDSGKHSEKDKTQEIAGFMFEKLHNLHPELSDKLEAFQNHLTSVRGKKAEFEALKAWQVQELGLQASLYTTLQDNLLESLIDVSGNFPSRAASLSSVRVPIDFKKAVSTNQQILQSHFNLDEGEGAFFIQGNFVDPDSLDLFTFMDTLQIELDLMESLRSVYHENPQTRAQIDQFLSIGGKSSSEPELALDMRDSSIYWINDLEKDEEYEDWPEDLTQLFYRMGGVMLRPVRRNVFNFMLTLNPEDASVTENLLRLAQSFMAHKAPLRIGVVFCSDLQKVESNSIEENKGDIIRRVFNYALSENKIKKAFNLLIEAYANNDFGTILKKFGNPGEEFDFGAEAACEYVKKGGRPMPGAFLNGIPLKWESVDDFEEIVLNQLLKEAQTIQIDAYQGKVGDSTDIFEYIMNKPSVQTRLNDKILDTSNAKYISFGNEMWEPGKELKNPIAFLSSNLNYLTTAAGKRKTPVSTTLWILADISTKHGHLFLQNSLEYLQESSIHSRVGFIPTDQKTSIFKTMVQQAFAENDLKKALSVLRDHSDEGGEEESSWDINQGLFLKIVGIPIGGMGLVVNGRVIGPLTPEEVFDLGDWALIEKFSYDSCGKYFEEEGGTGDTAMRLCAEFGNPKVKGKNSKRLTVPEFKSTYSPETKKENSDPYYLDIKAVIDPASRHANKMATLLYAVQSTISQWVRIQIIFNPPSKHSELPLKSYFRFIAGTIPRETISFSDIPRDPLFTQALIAPDNWMVEVVKGLNDLDNIRLRDLPGSISSEFKLANLIVEGHCLELKSGSPPRGVQFNLKTQAEGIKDAETIVMANLGYFQLKAQPGVWQLELRDGPSKEIFALEPQNMKPIVVQSFQSVVVKVKVKRNQGKETASLLDSEEESGGSWFNFGNANKEVEDDTINVFSLATGHLYERLLKIMMLSVMKNTKSKVKFWFLKNYLSPLIKDELPLLAKEYGFEYELVQYHWPRWLNPQREKQRIIWGYKILFLDVLFPLSLKKIVYVDADQVVQADLKELFDLDLEGNPYGYTPFCDSRTDMDGFRFWKSGYWRSHLGKRKYHISALYVVDLVRFRRVAAGDRLRGQYQALSQDPNSLSNLDQDLPNNMIHQVGIKSLPQEWLWCETWCDDASKKYAKTIDLCNNPMTKESKLDAAQRIIPEWKDYDQEIRDFQARIRGTKQEQENIDENENETETIADEPHDEL